MSLTAVPRFLVSLGILKYIKNKLSQIRSVHGRQGDMGLLNHRKNMRLCWLIVSTNSDILNTHK